MEVRTLARKVRDRPGRVPAALNQLWQTRLGWHDHNPAGKGIFQRDWDNLVILDACRYDKFEKCSTLEGDLSKTVSQASATEEFVTANFSGQQRYDTVYVSANGWYGKLKDSICADLHAHEFVERDWLDGYSTYPETVTERAREAAAEFPQKRLIVHYMQPHKPYLGDIGEAFSYVGDLYDTVKASNATRKDVHAAYEETLCRVIEEVRDLLPEIVGKTVVTGDHGELLGERQAPLPVYWYGHLNSLYVPELVDVPWHVCPFETRKKITAEAPEQTQSEYEIEEVEEQLVGLGYLEG